MALSLLSSNCISCLISKLSSLLKCPILTFSPFWKSSVSCLLNHLSSQLSEHATIPSPGVTPVVIRQYRYPSKMKDEIERQVTELLNAGFIHPSKSAFSSPVLLVRKKDSTWWLCVDYRMLNALTVKAKFPIPVVDELLDELAHAQWFSCLDLRARFNQIRMAKGEEYKTAFRTH